MKNPPCTIRQPWNGGPGRVERRASMATIVARTAATESYAWRRWRQGVITRTGEPSRKAVMSSTMSAKKRR